MHMMSASSDDSRAPFQTQFSVQCVDLRRETYIKAEPSESPNDRNDRAIRVAAAWYTQRIPAMPIIMLSNDVDNRRKPASQP